MQVGEFNPKTQNVLVVDYDGFRFEDSDAILDAPPAPSTSATIDSPAGIYTISLSAGYSEFYDIQNEDGFLILEQGNNPPQELIWTPDLVGLVYGDEVPLLFSWCCHIGALAVRSAAQPVFNRPMIHE